MDKKYISISELDSAIEELCKKHNISYGEESIGFGKELAELLDRLTANVVSKSVYDQVLWERDLAISQLEELGLSLGEKPDGKVQSVVYGYWQPNPREKGLHCCSVCKSSAIKKEDSWGYPYDETLSDFCPWCGAKMDEDDGSNYISEK